MRSGCGLKSALGYLSERQVVAHCTCLRVAGFFAQRVEREVGRDVAAQVERAFQLALARPPTEFERERAFQFLEQRPEGLVDFCQALFNLSEFVYFQ